MKIRKFKIFAIAFAALCAMNAAKVSVYAAPAYNSAYTKTYTLEELIRPALTKNTDAKGVYRQLKLALQYDGINEGSINHLYFDSNIKVPKQSIELLYNEGLISAYTWKTISGTSYTKEDVNPIFDAAYYYNANPDLQEAIGNDAEALFRHFINYGMAEGRVASAGFNPASYRAKNADVAAAYGDNTAQYYIHYMLYGRFEGRKAT